MRIASFVIALLLLGGAVDPTRGWLIALVVVTGLAATRLHHGYARPALDLRLGAFVLAVLLLAGTIDPTRDWLIGLSVVTGMAAFMPRAFSVDLFGFDRRSRHDWRWNWRRDWFSWDDDDEEGGWGRWERRMDRRGRRARAGDDWP